MRFLCKIIGSCTMRLGQDDMGEDIVALNRPIVLIVFILTTEAHN
jgi:hypothetical protein